MLRGNYAAKIDDKGRLKIPNAFRSLIEEAARSRAVRDEPDGGVRPHLPHAGLARRSRRSSRACPSTHPARLKFLDRVNFFGQTAEFDAQGRVLIHRGCASRPA